MKTLLAALVLIPCLALAADPALNNLTKAEVRDIANEIAVNLSHSAVAAPETEGLWGIEVGLVGGRTRSPELSDKVEDSGGDGDDFENIPHGGLLVRGHFPLDLFAEVMVLPTVKASDFEVSSRSFAVGWNAGGFFTWPVDVAVAAEFSSANFEFDQVVNSVDTNTQFETKSRRLWIGVSKTFLTFLTPYAKFGGFSSDSDIKVDGTQTIFNYTASQKQSVSSSGGYGALGLNIDVLLLRLGLEVSRSADVGRASAKLSLAF